MDCENCKKNLECEACPNKACSLCIHETGCCPGTYSSLCEDCLFDNLDLGPELFGFICEKCHSTILTCCDNYGRKKVCIECHKNATKF